MDREQEIELIVRWRDLKDEEAGRRMWEQVLSTIEGRVKKLAERLGFKKEYQIVLDDTYQELRAAVVDGHFDVDRPSRVSIYSFGIARNTLLNMHAERKREKKTLERYAAMKNWGAPHDPVTKEVIRREEVALLARAISELQEPEQSIFCFRTGIWPREDTLIETVELSIEEVAKLYGRSRGWVCKQYTKARTILQRKLSGKVN
jgi:RNA polymerase sigma factor (sigma-70 family)